MHQTSTEYCPAAGCLALTPINLLHHVIARRELTTKNWPPTHARGRPIPCIAESVLKDPPDNK
jgi:hypothetical protein